FRRACRAHPIPARLDGLLLLLALDHFPPLELRQRSALLDPDQIAHVILVGLVVRVVFLRAADGLLHRRMGVAALHLHHDGLVLLVAHHDALERALRHLLILYFALVSAWRFCCATVLMRAISRRTSRTRDVFSSWPVARWKRRLNCSFFSLSTSSSSFSTSMPLASLTFMTITR